MRSPTFPTTSTLSMTTLLLYRISGWIQIGIWISIVIFLIKQKFPQITKYKYFYIYLVLITLLELLYFGLALLRIPNLFLDYFYKSIEFICLSLFIQSIINSKNLYKFTLFSIFCFVCFQLYNALWGSGVQEFNFGGNVLNSIYLLLFSFGVLVYLLRNDKHNNLLRKPYFNIIFAVFLIFLTNILTEFTLKYAYQQQNISAQYIILISQNFLKSLYLLLFFRGVWLVRV